MQRRYRNTSAHGRLAARRVGVVSCHKREVLDRIGVFGRGALLHNHLGIMLPFNGSDSVVSIAFVVADEVGVEICLDDMDALDASAL